MDRFVHDANIEHYRRLLAESKRDPSRDEDRHNMLLTLLAEEEAKARSRATVRHLPTHNGAPVMCSAEPGFRLKHSVNTFDLPQNA